MVHVKVCGVTSMRDAVACADAGASSIGVNLVRGSPRLVSEATARAIVRAIGDRALVVAVVADRSAADMQALKDRTGVGCLQLHGDEPPEALEPLLPHAYKAIRIGTVEDVAEADRYAGEYLLVDAKVPGRLGGTGTAFDWSLVRGLARRRKILLAGGLTPENVAAAIRAVRPHSVDVASGVEKRGKPREKDIRRVRAFLASVLSSG
jgi:phosphoribosylanthranilate isomerase